MTKQPAYRGEYPGTVTNPEGTKLRVPNGFSWGYEGTGPFVLARAILRDHTGDEALAARYARDFMRDVTSHLGAPYHDGKSWELPVEEIERWLADDRPPIQF